MVGMGRTPGLRGDSSRIYIRRKRHWKRALLHLSTVRLWTKEEMSLTQRVGSDPCLRQALDNRVMHEGVLWEL